MIRAKHSGRNRPRASAGTLGDVLYADERQALVPETDWLAVVQSIASGDQHALHALYERTYLIVFTLAVRITGTREAAEELTVNVFDDVWRRAWEYDAACGSVVGWMMNQVRYRAMDRPRAEQRENPRNPSAAATPHRMLEHPPASLQQRVAQRIVAETGAELILLPQMLWREPEWREVAPGISCKLLATDTGKDRVSMLVHLEPGTDFPPHRHAGVEELHLLHGELMIDDRKLHPGDYNRAEPGTADSRVWSETGCTCVLVTSTRDELRK
jgi:RNA polymerase sigma-70 factor (ECF subfamily)